MHTTPPNPNPRAGTSAAELREGLRRLAAEERDKPPAPLRRAA